MPIFILGSSNFLFLKITHILSFSLVIATLIFTCPFIFSFWFLFFSLGFSFLLAFFKVLNFFLFFFKWLSDFFFFSFLTNHLHLKNIHKTFNFINPSTYNILFYFFPHCWLLSCKVPC